MRPAKRGITMATIFYGLSGEGRGHAARARVLVDQLRSQHRVVIYTYGAALEMLQPTYHRTDVEVRATVGMRFRYDSDGRLNRSQSFLGALPFLLQMPDKARQLARQLQRDRVNLVIADFEPLLPRAAALAGVPVMSVDHQQFLTCYDLSGLPPELRRRAEFLGHFVRPYYKNLVRAVISSFFFPPLKHGKHPVTQVGVLLRSEILDASPRHGDYLVAYVRREAPRAVLQALSECGRGVRVYGHGKHERQGNLTFHAIHPSAFAADLAGAAALVTSAGNQVVGEALSLRKPVLAYPEPGNLEQRINGHFLETSGQGWTRTADAFHGGLVRDFLNVCGGLRERILPDRVSGNRAAWEAVEQELARATSSKPDAPVTFLGSSRPERACASVSQPKNAWTRQVALAPTPFAS